MNDFDIVVRDMMAEFPTQGVYIQEVSGTYDPSTGEVTSTTLETPVEVLVFDLTLQSNGYSVKFGTLVEAGDKNILVRPPNKTDPAAPPLVLNPGYDRVRVAGITYKVLTAKEVNPTGSDTILYDLYVRR